MKQNKKAIYAKIVLTVVICCVLGTAARLNVFAGDINAEEQRVIAYYNRTFTYQGKQYVATEAAKQATYSKLAADGVDLTAAEVDSLILQASKNVAQGIQQGYLVEVTTSEETPKEEISEEEEEQKEEQKEETPDSPVTEKDKDKEDKKQNTAGDKEDKKENKKRKSADIEELKKEADKEGEKYGIVKRQEDGPITIEQYISGKVTAISEDGTVWYESSLPIKNTGYTKGKVWIIPIILIVGVALTSICGWKTHKKKVLWTILPIGFTLSILCALGIGGQEIGDKIIGEWKSIWISGAPEYQYESEIKPEVIVKTQQEITRPLPGSQYGQIQCEKLDLKAPLYYGDSDIVLEKGIGTYSGGALPWEEGTMLASGHDTSYFAPLENVEKGDVFYLDTIYGRYEYKVTGIKIADILDTDAYQLKEQGNELILYTCYPFGDTEGLRGQRFFVYAERTNETESGK